MVQKIRHKFRAKPTVRDGKRFDSKAEARYYEKLKLAEKSGDLLFFLQQVPVGLPGATTYRVDFLEFWANGDVVFTDVKGVQTETFKLKKRQIEEMYPFQLNIVQAK